MTQLDQITANSRAEIEEQKRVIAEAEAKRALAEDDVDRASRIKARLEDLLSWGVEMKGVTDSGCMEWRLWRLKGTDTKEWWSTC